MTNSVGKNAIHVDFYPHLLFSEHGDKYIYSAITNKIFILDDTIYNCIKTGEICSSIENYNDILTDLEEAYIIKTDKNTRLRNKVIEKARAEDRLYFSSITLMISQDCNLRCKYCYGDGGQYSNRGYMNFDIAKRSIDYFFKNASIEKRVGITFFGGEPLLSFNLIKQIVDYANKLSKECNISISYSMTTNGSLLTKEIETFLLENNIITQISMDGNEEAQNANRYYANKRGCYNDVVIRTKSLRTQNKICVRATVAPPNIKNFSQQMEHLISLGFRSLAWACADNLMSSQDIADLSVEVEKLMANFQLLVEQKQYTKAKKYRNIIKILNRLHNPAPRLRSCGAGRHMIAVNIDGDIYPCHRFVGIKQFCLGNVKNDNTQENKNIFYDELGVYNSSKCTNCNIQSLCAGGCINENYYASGSISIPREEQCEFTKKFCIDIIRLYTRLTPEQKNSLLKKSNDVTHP